MKSLLNWLDQRIAYRKILDHALNEPIPSGARFRYVTGSMLVFAFVTQAITGIFLWMAYSPSSQTAYESVWWIQFQMTGGWLVRGIHHFMAQAMVVVMGLHLLQVVVDGAYRAPREVNFWLGLVLMQIVMALGLTGYLLPWDQKGYWATNVATNLMTLVPIVGKETQQIAIGGSEYGHHTLTRFFALHAGVLPALLVGFLALHIAVFRKHGIMAKITPGRPDETFFPKQVLLDSIACLALLIVVLMFVIHFDFYGLVTGNLPIEHRGAELGAPADPSEQFSAARPEWYFLFLFQLLKYFPGSSEIIGAIVIPGILFGLLALMPIVGRWRVGHGFNVALIFALITGAAVLTGLAWREDYFAPIAEKLKLDPVENRTMITNSQEFLEAKEDAEHSAQRMYELINRQVMTDAGTLSDPLSMQKEGAVYLLRNDPLTQGPKLFARHCASCHQHRDPATPIAKDAPKPSAPNLYGFASRTWLTGLFDLEKFKSSEYFGDTSHKDGSMAEFLAGDGKAISKEDWNAITIALSAQADLHAQEKPDADSIASGLVSKGVSLINEHCSSCHRFGGEGELGTAPDLTGYGSYEWMMGLVSDPNHERFYRDENDRMPSFAKDLDKPATNALSVREISLVVDYLRGDYYVPASPVNPVPVLPHDEETARRTVFMSRLLSVPKRTVLGAKP